MAEWTYLRTDDESGVRVMDGDQEVGVIAFTRSYRKNIRSARINTLAGSPQTVAEEQFETREAWADPTGRLLFALNAVDKMRQLWVPRD